MPIIIAESFRNAIARIAENIPGAEARDAIQSYLALQHTESGELETAVEIVDGIEDTYQRDFAFGQIAVRCVATEQADHAESILDLIEDEGARALATEKLAIAYAETGDLDQAVGVTHRLPDSVPALAGVALACVHSGRKDEAIELLESIDYPDLKVPILVDLASLLVEVNPEVTALASEESAETTPAPEQISLPGPAHKAEALEFLAQANKAAEEIEVSSQRIEAQRLIISLYKKCGDETAALEILKHALDDHPEGTDDPEADYARTQVAAAYAELGSFADAERMLEEIGNPNVFANAAATVALEYKSAGNQSKALEVLGEALELAKSEEIFGSQTFKDREDLLDKLAQGYEELGSHETALEIIALMNDPARRDSTLGSIAKKSATSGNSGRAIQLVEIMEDAYSKTVCESLMVEDLATSNQPEMAERVLSQALDHARALEHPANRAMALANLAPWLHVKKQEVRAHEILFDALQSVAEIQQLDLQASALINVASNYASLKQDPNKAEEEVLEKITGNFD